MSALAGEVYDLALAPHERIGLRRVQVAVWALASIATVGALDGPSVGEWVVRRRADGQVLVRVDAGDAEDAAILRSELERQLAELTPEEFTERWVPEAAQE